MGAKITKRGSYDIQKKEKKLKKPKNGMLLEHRASSFMSLSQAQVYEDLVKTPRNIRLHHSLSDNDIMGLNHEEDDYIDIDEKSGVDLRSLREKLDALVQEEKKRTWGHPGDLQLNQAVNPAGFGKYGEQVEYKNLQPEESKLLSKQRQEENESLKAHAFYEQKEHEKSHTKEDITNEKGVKETLVDGKETKVQEEESKNVTLREEEPLYANVYGKEIIDSKKQKNDYFNKNIKELSQKEENEEQLYISTEDSQENIVKNGTENAKVTEETRNEDIKQQANDVYNNQSEIFNNEDQIYANESNQTNEYETSLDVVKESNLNDTKEDLVLKNGDQIYMNLNNINESIPTDAKKSKENGTMENKLNDAKEDTLLDTRSEGQIEEHSSHKNVIFEETTIYQNTPGVVLQQTEENSTVKRVTFEENKDPIYENISEVPHKRLIKSASICSDVYQDAYQDLPQEIDADDLFFDALDDGQEEVDTINLKIDENLKKSQEDLNDDNIENVQVEEKEKEIAIEVKQHEEDSHEESVDMEAFNVKGIQDDDVDVKVKKDIPKMHDVKKKEESIELPVKKEEENEKDDYKEVLVEVIEDPLDREKKANEDLVENPLPIVKSDFEEQVEINVEEEENVPPHPTPNNSSENEDDNVPVNVGILISLYEDTQREVVRKHSNPNKDLQKVPAEVEDDILIQKGNEDTSVISIKNLNTIKTNDQLEIYFESENNKDFKEEDSYKIKASSKNKEGAEGEENASQNATEECTTHLIEDCSGINEKKNEANEYTDQEKVNILNKNINVDQTKLTETELLVNVSSNQKNDENKANEDKKHKDDGDNVDVNQINSKEATVSDIASFNKNEENEDKDYEEVDILSENVNFDQTKPIETVLLVSDTSFNQNSEENKANEYKEPYDKLEETSNFSSVDKNEENTDTKPQQKYENVNINTTNFPETTLVQDIKNKQNEANEDVRSELKEDWSKSNEVEIRPHSLMLDKKVPSASSLTTPEDIAQHQMHQWEEQQNYVDEDVLQQFNVIFASLEQVRAQIDSLTPEDDDIMGELYRVLIKIMRDTNNINNGFYGQVIDLQHQALSEVHACLRELQLKKI